MEVLMPTKAQIKRQKRREKQQAKLEAKAQAAEVIQDNKEVVDITEEDDEEKSIFKPWARQEN